MTAVGDFPSNCSTNTYILQDFGELAYIVCTVSTPPSSNHTIQVPSPESNLARLKLTESQFRQASILAAIDSDTSQLFTFYKKVDVLKDQKTLLHKFGQILRSNSCNIAYKAAARVPELFKPEHTKLYRLFVSAILASIKVVSDNDQNIVRLGQRYHLVEQYTGDPYDPVANAAWSLIRTDLQILQTGHVALTVVVNKDIDLVPLSAISSQLPRVTGVVLAPGGQNACYRNQADATTNTALPLDSTMMTGQCRSMWQDRVTAWMKSTWNIDIVSEAIPWVEVMLLVFEQKVDEGVDDASPNASAESERRPIFKPILWPAHLCFARSLDANQDNIEATGVEDPLQFVLDWIQTAAERETELQQQILDEPKDDDSALFVDEGPFDNMETFQHYGPPTFPASQTVYPTPPDVVMTHATPAMSSVDGLAMTPATISRGPGEAHRGQHDVEMTGVDPTQASGVGSGFYEEDLFEEMPEGTFDQEGDGAEPNWDFFDKPGMDAEQSQAGEPDVDSQPSKGSPGSTNPDSAQNKGSAPQPGIRESGPPVGVNVDPHQVPAAADNWSVRSGSERGGRAQRKSSSEADQAVYENPGANPAPRRRRSSVYDVVEPMHQRGSHDAKYSQKGEFWFDAGFKPHLPERTQNLDGWKHREPSTPSVSESDSYLSEDDGDATPESPASAKPVSVLPWHEYQPAPASEEKRNDEIDASALDAGIRATLELLKVKGNGPSQEEIFRRKGNASGKIGLPAELRLMLAQIFVDQYTQATLLHSGDNSEDERRGLRNEMEVSVDLSQMNCTVGYATVSQLTEITPSIGGRQPTGKTVRLTDNYIAIKRSDKPLVATPTIVAFWDTLALQPYSRPKDIVAFCLYPSGAGYTEGSAHFLSRIAGAYGSCGLGTHSHGLLPGLTDNGTIAMPPEPAAVARRFAEALISNTGLTGTAIVYIVALAADAKSYCHRCKYFVALFTFYKRLAESRGKPLELVLQIIPASFLVSFDALVVPSQRKYNDLAFEVYSRIPPESSAAPGTCDYPLTLADASPDVQFHLESQGVLPTSKNQNALHLAYSFTEDQRWLVAAWTDILGHKALVMTYQLKVRSESKGRPREDIMKEMWEVSRDLMRKQRNKWRLIVARSGFYEAAEVNGWMHLANAEIRLPACELHLLSVEVQPTLRLLPPNVQAKAGQQPGGSQQAMYGTPASTPQAVSTTSPENLVPATPTPGGTSALNAPTPPEYAFDTSVEGDLSLTDPLDESWALILPFGTNQSSNTHDIRPALISGYLIKRLGTRNEDGTTMVGVHLVHAPAQSPATPCPREELLEEILDQYRGLATLAMARGCINKMRQVLPWHIHTSVTGTGVLGNFL